MSEYNLLHGQSESQIYNIIGNNTPICPGLDNWILATTISHCDSTNDSLPNTTDIRTLFVAKSVTGCR